MNVQTRIRLIKLSEKVKRNNELQRLVFVELLEKNEKSSTNFEKALERNEAVWQTIDRGGKQHANETSFRPRN